MNELVKKLTKYGESLTSEKELQRAKEYKDSFKLFTIIQKSEDSEVVIAGYASVEGIDLHGDVIPIETLTDMLSKFLKAGEKYWNINLEHSSTQVGVMIKEYGKLRTEVDDRGLFILCKLRTDLESSKLVKEEILKGLYNSFSVKVEVINSVEVCSKDKTCYTKLTDCNLIEVSIVKNPANPEARFIVV